MNKAIVMAIAALMAFVPVVAGEQTVEGTILLQAAGTDLVGIVAPGLVDGGVSANSHRHAGIVLNGVDGWVFDLEENLSEFSLTGDAGALGVCDLDMYFYDANGGALEYLNGGVGLGTVECDEGGDVPAGAAVGVISLYIGFNTNFVFEAE